ncbi:MAG: serine acetyltransferase [Alicyclobacillaceae bacterium]|nr:serine acetyltransferase [Alicyclobacillaceae bacterium]
MLGVNFVRNMDRIAQELTSHSMRVFQGCACHPEPEAINRMVKALRSALLPNYFPHHAGTAMGEVKPALEELFVLLSGQIHRALYRQCYDKEGSEETRRAAEEKAATVIEQMPLLQEMLYEDVVETHHGDPAASGYDEIILTYPGLLALTIYRTAHVMVGLDIPLLPRMMTEYGHRLTGVDLHPGAKIGRSIMIDHGTGIVVGETAVVGSHVKIYQGVTLGALYFPRDEVGAMDRQTKRHPTVEDYAVLYANATVLGGETVIGHHSVIGSNAWVTASVEPYSKVLYQGEPVVVPRKSRV